MTNNKKLSLQTNREQAFEGTTSRLQASVNELYRVFANYSAPATPFHVCTYCCMDANLEKEMRQLPLRQLSRLHLSEYNQAAESNAKPDAEIKYLLPRMLELMAQGAELHHSQEVVLRRLGDCSPDEFSSEETKAVLEYALAHFEQGLQQMPWTQGSLFGDENAFTYLLMWALAGVEIRPLMDLWIKQASVSSTLHFAFAYAEDYLPNWEWGNAFAEDHPAIRQELKEWLDSDECFRKFVPELERVLDAEDLPVADCACEEERRRHYVETAHMGLITIH